MTTYTRTATTLYRTLLALTVCAGLATLALLLINVLAFSITYSR